MLKKTRIKLHNALAFQLCYTVVKTGSLKQDTQEEQQWQKLNI